MDIKLILFGVYCIGILLVGYLGYLKTKTLGDFYLAGRKINKWIGAGTFAATFVSAITFVSWIGFGWQFGTALVPVYIFGCLVGFFLYAIVAPKINIIAHRNETYTPSDYYEGRFDSSFLKLWATTFTIVGFCVYLVIQLIGTGVLFEVIVGIPFAQALIILGIVYTIYTLLGGMKSVAWTDTIQFSVFVLATIIAFIYVLPEVGGFSGLTTTIKSINPSLLTLTSGGTFSPLWIFGIAFAVAVVIPLHYGYFSRAMAAKSPREARAMVGIGSTGLLIFYLAIAVLALAARAYIPDTSAIATDEAFPTMVLEHFPTLLAAFILASLGAAVMSTTDSILLQVGANVSNDIYAKFINPDASDKKTLMVARVLVIVFAIITILLGLTKPAVLWEIYNFFIVFLVAPYFAIFFLGLYWKKATKAGAIVGAVSGGVIGCAINGWQVLGGVPEVLSYHPTLYAVPISVVLMIIVSYMTKPLPKEVVEKWYKI